MMIALTRTRTESAIPTSYRGATPRDRLVKLMQKVQAKLAAGEELRLDIGSKWSVTKKQLLLETRDKCAYCETPTAVVAFGDVEHYRPKSVYWWLAYVYDNYLASCAVCNQQFKGKKFEIDGPMMSGPPITTATTAQEMTDLAETVIPDPLTPAHVTAFEAAHRAEQPRIPNPYFDDPEEIFGWDVLDGSKEVELIAKAAVPGAADKVDAAERIYGLNRPELKRLRFKQFKFYNVARQTADAAGVPREIRDLNLELIESMKEPDSQYAGMIRFFEDQ